MDLLATHQVGAAYIAQPGDDLLVVQDALEKLEAADQRAREIVNLRYFTGLSNQETADALGVSVKTIEREWRFARAWISRRIEGELIP